MESLILFIASALPVFLLGMYIYKKDKNKEPGNLLSKLFVGGILSCFLVLILSSILNFFFPFFSSDYTKLNLLELFVFTFIGVALVEEICKWIIAYKISFNDKEFEEIYDMIVYAVFVALGFAFVENLLYVFDSGIGVAFIRAILAVPGHACDGVFMGYYLGMAKQSLINNRDDLKNKYLLFSIVVPTITHGIYDYCLFSNKILLIFLFFIFVILVYIFANKKIRRMSSIEKKMKYQYNFCPNCGRKVNSNFCPNCGRKNS